MNKNNGINFNSAHHPIQITLTFRQWPPSGGNYCILFPPHQLVFGGGSSLEDWKKKKKKKRGTGVFKLFTSRLSKEQFVMIHIFFNYKCNRIPPDATHPVSWRTAPAPPFLWRKTSTCMDIVTSPWRISPTSKGTVQIYIMYTASIWRIAFR